MTDAMKHSVAKSLETITEQPTYLEIELFSAAKSNYKSGEKNRVSMDTSIPHKETQDQALSPIKIQPFEA